MNIDWHRPTRLEFELGFVLPRVDPEQGDDLTVTSSVETVRPLVHDLMGKLDGYHEPAMCQNDHLDRLGAPEDPVARVNFILDNPEYPDYTFLIRQRAKVCRSVSMWYRPNQQAVFLAFAVGGMQKGAPTVFKALGKLGVHRVYTTRRHLSEAQIKEHADRGWVTHKGHSGRVNMVFNLPEEWNQ